MTSRSIQQVLEEYTPRWMALPGVVGTAVGKQRGQPCIHVYVVRMTDALRSAIPQSVESYAVKVIETGELRAL